MIGILTRTHADWTGAIVRVLLGLIFFAHGVGTADPVLPRVCVRSPSIYAFPRFWLFL